MDSDNTAVVSDKITPAPPFTLSPFFAVTSTLPQISQAPLERVDSFLMASLEL